MKKRNILRERISVQIAKNPSGVILMAILLLNLFFFAISALVISALAPESLRDRGFWPSVFYTITMILDAGCIQFVVEEVGRASVGLIIVCLMIVIVGSITFTGAVIGYVTNYISNFIESANAGEGRLHISDHTIILNWNSRASEIINDMLYNDEPSNVVVLVSSGKEDIEREIDERLSNTIDQENRALREQCADMSRLARYFYLRRHGLDRRRVTVIVREGDSFSTKKLNDISIGAARTVIILGKDIQNSTCKYDYEMALERYEKGNSNTVKTLIQVAELTGREDSADNQKIVVEADDEWTLNLIYRVIEHKENLGKCNIVPIAVNRVLGQILSQFSIMPELNAVYGELFSNKGAAFFSRSIADHETDEQHIHQSLRENARAIPLTAMDGKLGRTFYYLAEKDSDVAHHGDHASAGGYSVKHNRDYWLEKRNVIILGHNSNCNAVMQGFRSFSEEWDFRSEALIAKNGGRSIVDITVIDDKKNLDKQGHYRDYPFVTRTVEADIYDRELICSEINRFVDSHVGDTSILVLSDDMVTSDETDAAALTYLIYVQEIISERMAADPNFDPESIDVVVEILNPKNYDIVHSYSIDNIVISNRYISKMITQIGEKEEIYNFYADIMTYDAADADAFESKELYVKKVGNFFLETPAPCTAEQLIRAVYDATPEDNHAIVCGYVRHGGEMVLFSGDQKDIKLSLRPDDKLIIFSNH